MVERVRDGVEGNLREQENRCRHACGSKFNPLVDYRYGQPVRSGVERGLRGQGRAVTVAVGFDDGAEHRFAHHGFENFYVVRNGRG